MAKNYYITLEVHDEGEWPRIAPENLMQHVDVRLPSGLTLADAKVSETVNSFDELVSALEVTLPMAEKYLSGAPSHPDNAKLEDARAVLAKVRRSR